jgi:hypothetical protein
MGSDSPWLGSPPIPQAFDTDRSLWPASAVVLRTGPEDSRYEVRQLATGKIVARGVAGDGALGVIGNLFVRQTEKRELSAVDVTTGDEVWTRPADFLSAARAPDDSLDWLAFPDGVVLLSSALRDIDDLAIGDHLHVLDPRSGKVTEEPTRLPGASGAIVVPADGPEITAASAIAGPMPRVPVIEDWIDDHVLADGRAYEAKLDRRDSAATTTQVGWQQLVPQLAGKDRLAIVVHDRRSGKRLVRHTRKGENEFYVHSEGDRLVVTDDGRDYVVKPWRRRPPSRRPWCA